MLPRTFLAMAAAALALPTSASAALVTKIDTAPAAFTASGQATFTFHAEDSNTHQPAAATFECRTGTAAFTTCSSPLTISGLSEGAHTEQIRWLAGNASDPNPATASWTVDQTPPTTTVTRQPKALTNDRDATFAFTSPDTSATFRCSLNGGDPQPCTSPYTLTGLSDASRTLRIQAVDAAGNADPAAPSIAWTLDTTPPETTLAAAPPVATNAQTVSVTAASEDGATFICSYDGAPSQPCAATTQSPSLSEGNHAVAYTAIDAAGNTDPTPATASWTVDRTPPAPVSGFQVVPAPPLPTLVGPIAQHLTAPVVKAAPGPVIVKPVLPVTAVPAQSSFVLPGSVVVQWNHPGDAVSYRVYAMNKMAGFGFGAPSVSVSDPTTVSAPAASVDVTPGWEVCVGVQAIDAAGNVSAGRQTCPSALSSWDNYVESQARGIKKHSDPAGATGSYLTGSYPARIGFVIGQLGPIVWCSGAFTCNRTHEHTSALALLVTKCAGCGRISLGLREHHPSKVGHNYSDATFSDHRTIDLRARKTQRDQIITIPLPSAYANGTAALAGIRVLSGHPRLQGLSLQTIDCELPDAVTASLGSCVPTS